MSFTPINTQEEFDEAIKGRLERAEKTFKEKYADYEDLKKKVNEQETQITGLNDSLTAAKTKVTEHEETITNLNTEIAKHKTASAKIKIAREYGIPYELSDRITGEDEEAMKKDAESLSKFIKESGSTPPPMPSHDDDKGDSKEAALKNLARGLKGE